MWTEGTTVLQWLHSLEKQPVFVANRVTEILEPKTDDVWNHVLTGDHPADAGSRVSSAAALFESSWLKGPDFLRSLNWLFIPCTDVITKMKSREFERGTELMEKETHEMMACAEPTMGP